MTKVCKECKGDFEAKRATAVFCSPSCRVTASRVSVTDQEKVSVTNLSVTDEYSVTKCETKEQMLEDMIPKQTESQLDAQARVNEELKRALLDTSEVVDKDFDKLMKLFNDEGMVDLEEVVDYQKDYFHKFGRVFVPNRFMKHFN